MIFTLILWMFLLLNSVVATLVLFRPWARNELAPEPVRLRLADIVRCTAVVCGLGLAELLAIASGSIFAVIHLVYLHLVILVPMLGVLVFIAGRLRNSRSGRPWRGTSPPVKVIAALALLGAPVGVWATFIEPYRLELTQTDVSTGRPSRSAPEIRVVVLADIQTDNVGAHEHRAIDMALAQQPDIILLPGDLWQGDPNISPDDLARLRTLLNKLSAPGGVYFCRGNCEDGRYIESYLEGTPVRLLTNQIVRTDVRGRPVTLAGVELDLTNQAAATVRKLEDAPGNEDLRILIAHYPDHIRSLRPNSRIDLVVAGHTHGGQIAIPGWGPPITLSHVPREAAAGGLHTVNGNKLYVSRGIGWERAHAPRIRLFCRPEVSLLRFAAF